MQYPHLAQRLFDTPLMISRMKLDVILSAIGGKFGVQGPDVPAELMQEQRDRDQLKITPQGIAIVTIRGSLVRRASGMSAMSGMTSYEQIANEIAAAVGDKEVKGILLDIDSPGGEVAGFTELVDTIVEAGTIKPIWAVANDDAYSAAYAIASTAEQIYVTQTGGVGSVGVIAIHLDHSEADEKEGLAYRVFRAGKFKAELNSYEPLTDHASSALQEDLDRIYDIFVEMVATNRGMSVKGVRATEALTFSADKAVEVGFADQVGTLDDALSALAERIQGSTEDPTPVASDANGLTGTGNLFAVTGGTWTLDNGMQFRMVPPHCQMGTGPGAGVFPAMGFEQKYANDPSVQRICEEASGSQDPGSIEVNSTEGACGFRASDMIVVEQGWSLNGNYWTKDAIRQLSELLSNKVVGYVNHGDVFHRDPRDWSQVIEEAWVEGDAKRVRANSHIFQFPDGETFKERIDYMKNHEAGHLFGVSVDVWAQTEQGEIDGKEGTIIKTVLEVNSVDTVMVPSAGGRYVPVKESVGNDEEDKMKKGTSQKAHVQEPGQSAPAPEGAVEQTELQDQITALETQVEELRGELESKHREIEKYQEKEARSNFEAAVDGKMEALTEEGRTPEFRKILIDQGVDGMERIEEMISERQAFMEKEDRGGITGQGASMQKAKTTSTKDEQDRRRTAWRK